jgi:alanyl-tRNA synthetase
MNSKEIRESFLKFFEGKGHLRMKSASLIPNDPTLLFTAAGMVPLKAYYLGEEIPPNRRITTVQKCLRTNDIDNVGYTARHHTFFEMLGNFSIGDYFKEEAIPWAYEYVTEVLKLPKERLWVTVYKDDNEAKEIWEKVGIPAERIVTLGEEDNFWTMGPVGPCGPCSEIYYDRGAKTPEEEKQLPGDEGERFLEFWNLVFTQYDRQIDGTLKPLPRKNIDTGMGLERITSILEGVETDFETDLFMPIIQEIERLSGEKYHIDSIKDRSFRAISDHVRAVSFLIADGLVPSNEKRGYVLRRLIRRSALFGRAIGLKEPFLYKLVPVVVQLMGDIYPELSKGEEKIINNLRMEEQRFNTTLNNGFAYFDEVYKKIKEAGKKEFPPESAFYLYDTLGFPLELTESILRSYGLTLDREKFDLLLEEQRERARKAFKGGESFTERVSLVKLKEKIGESKFVGYDTLKASSTVLAILKNNETVENASEGESVAIVTKETPFYAEKGGQVGDTGVIRNGSFLFEVEDTQTPIQGLIVHIGTVKKGTVFINDTVLLEVNAERRNAIMRAHTSTHILQAVLRREFGEQLGQQGSAVYPDEFHFDFNFNEKISEEKLIELEREMNEIIISSAPVLVHEMPIEEAKKSGALAFFEEKYGEIVRVVEIPNVSKEFCGGTHVKNTNEIGVVLLRSFRSVASGIRRIEGISGKKAYDEIKKERLLLKDMVKKLGGSVDALDKRIDKTLNENKQLKKEISALKKRVFEAVVGNSDVLENNGVRYYIKYLKNASMNDLKDAFDSMKKQFKNGIAVLSGESDGKSYLLVGALSGNEHISAKDIFNRISEKFGIKGGGSDRLVRGSGNKKITEKEIKSVLQEE